MLTAFSNRSTAFDFVCEYAIFYPSIPTPLSTIGFPKNSNP